MKTVICPNCRNTVPFQKLTEDQSAEFGQCPVCKNFFAVQKYTFTANNTFVGAVSGAAIGTAVAGVPGAVIGGFIGAVLGANSSKDKGTGQ
jgi:uncharacterized membrane protein